MQRGWLLGCADHRKRNRARLSPRHPEGKSDRRKRKVKKDERSTDRKRNHIFKATKISEIKPYQHYTAPEFQISTKINKFEHSI
jgi:hypothetical protein